jgi:hypothetical protein
MTMIIRLTEWFCSRDTGESSKCIAAYMAGADMDKVRSNSTPYDPSDLGRCLRLLEKFPEWKPRMGEMAQVSKGWEKILPHWDEAARIMEQEVGIDWSKGRKAPATYEFMKSKGF